MSLRRWAIRSLFQSSRATSYTPAIAARQQKDHHNVKEKGSYYRIGAGAVLCSVLVGAGTLSDSKPKVSEIKKLSTVKADAGSEIIEAGAKRPDLPTFTAEEVSKHDDKSSFWVTYKYGVYDVTKFLPSHPGGEQIYNAAGLSIEPFWNVYGMHKTQEVYKLLESYRIGNLQESDVVEHSDAEMWAREPRRDVRLRVQTARPFNAEIPPDLQIQHFDTPNELFYVRQHMPVPELDEKTHTLRVTVVHAGRGEGEEAVTKREFTLDELNQFRKGTVRAALMCAGNRRSEMVKEVKDKQVKGISWASGAIGNAVWSGVYLRDVLLHCGVDETRAEGLHVIFQGSDMDATGVNFSTSIPLAMALNPLGDILLATHMNGAPLPPDHGHPLRVVVPGAPAVRSVKWLECIIVSEDESPSHWHQKDYRSFNATKTWETADFPSAPPVYSLPVTSAICDPADGGCVRARHGYIEAKGYAYSGGGAKVVRVDISPDCGTTWLEAELTADSAPPQQHYAWTLWTIRIPVPEGQQEMEIWAKATDSNFNTQPERFEHIWNIRGILGNAYHRIRIQVEH